MELTCNENSQYSFYEPLLELPVSHLLGPSVVETQLGSLDVEKKPVKGSDLKKP